MTAKKKSDSENQRVIDSYDYLGPAASSMDCTGLIPSGPKSRAELDAYEELYPFTPPKTSTSPDEIPPHFYPQQNDPI